MIEIIPAIDLIEGKCVRLTKGDYGQKTVYDDNPLEVAKRLEAHGIKRLHLVDLDGAKSKHVTNHHILRNICKETKLTVDFGGGIKTQEDLDKVFDAGAAMATAGSIAVTNPETVWQWIEHYGPHRLVLGADVRNNKVSINGWTTDSQQELIPFLRNYISRGIRNILCTDINRDGMMQGPNTTLYKQIMKEFPHCHLIASGGISGNADIEQLNQAGIPAVVFGKALYEGKINLDTLHTC